MGSFDKLMKEQSDILDGDLHERLGYEQVMQMTEFDKVLDEVSRRPSHRLSHRPTTFQPHTTAANTATHPPTPRRTSHLSLSLSLWAYVRYMRCTASS